MRSRVLVVCAAIALAFVSIAPARADFIERVFGCSGDPCVVANNEGGPIYRFEYALEEVKRGVRKAFIVDGLCESGCAFFADKARAVTHICVTHRARFGFHKGWIVVPPPSPLFRFDPNHSPDIARWVADHGGYPSAGMLVMEWDDAKKFWPPCRQNGQPRASGKRPLPL